MSDMGSLTDAEISAIWDRVKHYLDIESIQAGTIDEVASQLESMMERLPDSRNKAQKQTLINNNFIQTALTREPILSDDALKTKITKGDVIVTPVETDAVEGIEVKVSKRSLTPEHRNKLAYGLYVYYTEVYTIMEKEGVDFSEAQKIRSDRIYEARIERRQRRRIM